MATTKDERTLGEMFAELSRETRTLVQQELQLAKTELTEKASKLGKGAGLIVGGGLIAYGGLLAIIAAMVLIMIALGVPPWAAALVGGSEGEGHTHEYAECLRRTPLGDHRIRPDTRLK